MPSKCPRCKSDNVLTLDTIEWSCPIFNGKSIARIVKEFTVCKCDECRSRWWVNA